MMYEMMLSKIKGLDDSRDGSIRMLTFKYANFLESLMKDTYEKISNIAQKLVNSEIDKVDDVNEIEDKLFADIEPLSCDVEYL